MDAFQTTEKIAEAAELVDTAIIAEACFYQMRDTVIFPDAAFWAGDL